MLGKISSSSPSGIKVRTDFFDEIFVPANMLPPNSSFNHQDQLWIWDNDNEMFYFDHHEAVRFRIESENWVDQAPMGPTEKEEGVEKASPYTIEASMADAGLGPCLWWDGE